MSQNYLLTIMHPNGPVEGQNNLLSKTSVLSSNFKPHYSQFVVQTNKGEELRELLRQFGEKQQVDTALIDESFTKKKKLLFIFDMDSTLVAAEVINVLADLHGVGEQTKEITKIAMNGGMSFDESLKKRLGMLKGMSKSQLQHVDDKLPLSPGVEIFMKRAHSLGHITAIASGGFNFFANDLRARLGMNYAYSNELEFIDDKLTGNVIGPIVNAEMKEKLVGEISARENLTPADVVSIGDGANDLLMLAKSHMGVAFHAKQTVRDQAKFHINYGGMDHLLYYLGMQE